MATAAARQSRRPLRYNTRLRRQTIVDNAAASLGAEA